MESSDVRSPVWDINVLRIRLRADEPNKRRARNI